MHSFSNPEYEAKHISRKKSSKKKKKKIATFFFQIGDFIKIQLSDGDIYLPDFIYIV